MISAHRCVSVHVPIEPGTPKSLFFVCAHGCVFMCMCVCVHVGMCVYVHVWACVCVSVHTGPYVCLTTRVSVH